jgi:hypothetical protein
MEIKLSTKKVVIVVCNGCGTTALNPTMVIVDAANMEHPVDSVTGARAHAHAKGWVHDKIGRDMCPDCRTFKAPKRHKLHGPRHWGRA